MPRIRNIRLAALGLPLVLLARAAGADAPATADYARDIKPLLRERCYACHGALKQKAGLRLDTVTAMRRGGDGGDALAGDPALLLQRVTTTDLHDRMPPEGEGALLSAEQVALLRDWLRRGAPGLAREEPEADPRAHWAYQPPRDAGRSMDQLLLQRLQSDGLTPQPAAEPEVWLRRVWLDLTGLPPEPADVRRFLEAHARDAAPARRREIDRLLASPQYGERWGRHFMDIWRYSDWYGLGDQLRNSQKHLWHWRDWIVESLNADKGYDTMILQMLAADELAPEDRGNLRATGFLARSYYLFNRTTWLDETLEHTSRALLGVTLQCVKCHDHKYDPIDHAEYYRMRAVFEPMHVRLDPWPGETDLARNGLPRVYDLHLERPTYRHVRGDEKNEDRARVLEPGVPQVLGAEAYRPVALNLPPTAVQPALLPFVRDDQLRAAEAGLRRAEAEVARLRPLAAVGSQPAAKAGRMLVAEDFRQPVPGRYRWLGGDWQLEPGRLRQSLGGAERRMAELAVPPPPDFAASLSFTIRGGRKWKSVGLAFDGAGRDDTLVYLSAAEGGSKLQLALARDGRSSYPAEAAVAREVRLGQPYTLEVRVRGPLVNVSVNGQPALAYQLPQPRRPGAIRLTAFDAEVDFTRFTLAALPPEAPLFAPGGLKDAGDPAAQLRIAELTLQAARLRPELIRRVLAADADRNNPALARRAAEQEALVKLAEAELALARAGQAAGLRSPDAKARSAAAKTLTEARAAVAKAKEKSVKPGAGYTPLRVSLKAQEGPDEAGNADVQTYPARSSGRRLALARWMTDRRHPLTARVLVNHVWLRHFGAPLVADVTDFGRRSPAPLHQDVLDTLAVRFMANGWSLKWLHREMMLSELYARSSSNAGAAAATLSADPDNSRYWRMNPRRLESQAVRDSLLRSAGRLDLTLGGPTLDPAKAETAPRRSLYFNQTAHEEHRFLAAFDNANVLECYRREESVVPQQALALANSRLARDCADALAARLDGLDDAAMIREAFLVVLGRAPADAEARDCADSLKVLSRGLFLQALFNHNDFVTLR